MTIQMREGWVLLRDGSVHRASRTDEHREWPWSVGDITVRNDGSQSLHRGFESVEDVIELLDPWDDRVPEEHRQLKPIDEQVAGSTADPVNHPPHYTTHPSGVECIQITQHMNFCLGNAVKYIWRADLKHDAVEDLRKAAWYINREIERRESQQ